jgi:hypothetical protein
VSEGCEFSKAGTRNATAAFCVKVGAATMNPMLNFADTGGLFDHFEVNREPFWPRIVWLIAGSGAWHLVILALIVMIPPVRNALSIAAIFSGADFVDRPYSRTVIGDNVDFLDYSGEKFHYPEGYWAMDQQGIPPLPAFPVTPAYTPASVSPALSPSPSPSLTPTPAPTPAPAIAASGSNKDGKAGDGKGSSTAGSAEDKAAQEKAAEEKLQAEREKAAKTAGIEMPEEGEINKKPFQDLGAEAKGMSDKNQLDMTQQFEVTIEAELNQQGKLVNTNIAKKSGDAQLIYLSKRFVETMNDSGVLFYLKALSQNNPTSKVVFTIKQNTSAVVAIIEVEAKDADSARVLTRGFNATIAYGVTQRKGKVEEQLLRDLKASQDGQKIIFNFSMPREEAVALVKKELASASPTPATP